MIVIPVPEQLDGRSWVGRAWAELVIIYLQESADHPGFYHYTIDDVRTEERTTSHRPVATTSLKTFFDAMFADSLIEPHWRVEEIGLVAGTPRKLKPLQKKRELVYFMQAGPFVKIGFTSGSPQARAELLQVGCPYEIKVLCTIPGSRRKEKLLQHRYRKFHVRGEWFKLGGKLERFIHSKMEAGE